MSQVDELLRIKFEDLRAKKAATEALLDPHRQARDALMAQVQQLEAQAKVHAEAMRAIRDEAGLVELDNDIARLARELNPRVQRALRAAAAD